MQQDDSAIQVLKEEIMRKIGRNVLRYQQLENTLKGLLPILHPEAGAKGLDAYNKYKLKISERTLGQLFGEFNQSISVSTADNTNPIETGLKAICESRNYLVHSLLKDKKKSFETEQGCKELISYLDQCFEEINEVFALLKPIIEQIKAMADATPKDENGLFTVAVKSSLEIELKAEKQTRQ